MLQKITEGSIRVQYTDIEVESESLPSWDLSEQHDDSESEQESDDDVDSDDSDLESTLLSDPQSLYQQFQTLVAEAETQAKSFGHIATRTETEHREQELRTTQERASEVVLITLQPSPKFSVPYGFGNGHQRCVVQLSLDGTHWKCADANMSSAGKGIQLLLLTINSSQGTCDLVFVLAEGSTGCQPAHCFVGVSK
jgi:hypothetical protein